MKEVILPSVMAENQKELNALFKHLEGVAPLLHLDIADGKFVPTRVLDFDLRLSNSFSYGAHLMVKDPEKYIEKLSKKKKIDYFLSQWEVLKNPKMFISWLKSKNLKVGFALKPETKVKEIAPYLSDVDILLILTVHPGYYGAKFLKSPLTKIRQMKKINPAIKIIVDGGMNPETISLAKKAGGDYFVSGSFISKAKDPRKNLQLLKKALK